MSQVPRVTDITSSKARLDTAAEKEWAEAQKRRGGHKPAKSHHRPAALNNVVLREQRHPQRWHNYTPKK